MSIIGQTAGQRMTESEISTAIHSIQSETTEYVNRQGFWPQSLSFDESLSKSIIILCLNSTY